MTGLPQPRADHASVMAKFASRSMNAVNHLINSEELITRLGEDTAQLSMRVGLHSGPTTAGVLRGQKSRFQLFGDTVNTASRMESNGAKGRIHCSQATADSLIECSKGDWLQIRKDKIAPKGKGEMQTYWIVRPPSPPERVTGTDHPQARRHDRPTIGDTAPDPDGSIQDIGERKPHGDAYGSSSLSSSASEASSSRHSNLSKGSISSYCG